MNVQPMGFHELARASHVKRWHIINTTREQNLAEHQYNVTVIGLELYKQLIGETASAMFMSALLFHDSSEIRYGDIPTPGKAFIQSYAGKCDLFSSMDEGIMPKLPYVDNEHPGVVDSEHNRIIKLADLIEAAWWIGENGAGAHAASVADKCRRAMVDAVHACGYYDAVNYVLMNLGMSIICAAERLTPP
jgi:5'-deoxynucleotidase YfbR-like HD superfamily hydrolase